MSELEIETMSNNINTVKLFVEDLWKDNDDVIIKVSDSISASTDFDDNYFDFIYIDAGHTYNRIYDDLTYWYPKLKTGGVLGGHDYNHMTVKKAISDFLTSNKIPMKVKHCITSVALDSDGCSDWVLINK